MVLEWNTKECVINYENDKFHAQLSINEAYGSDNPIANPL